MNEFRQKMNFFFCLKPFLWWIAAIITHCQLGIQFPYSAAAQCFRPNNCTRSLRNWSKSKEELKKIFRMPTTIWMKGFAWCRVILFWWRIGFICPFARASIHAHKCVCTRLNSSTKIEVRALAEALNATPLLLQQQLQLLPICWIWPEIMPSDCVFQAKLMNMQIALLFFFLSWMEIPALTIHPH